MNNPLIYIDPTGYAEECSENEECSDNAGCGPGETCGPDGVCGNGRGEGGYERGVHVMDEVVFTASRIDDNSNTGGEGGHGAYGYGSIYDFSRAISPTGGPPHGVEPSPEAVAEDAKKLGKLGWAFFTNVLQVVYRAYRYRTPVPFYIDTDIGPSPVEASESLSVDNCP